MLHPMPRFCASVRTWVYEKKKATIAVSIISMSGGVGNYW